MRVGIDTEVCQAYGNCMMAAPEVFDLDEERGVAFLLREAGEGDREAVEEAVRTCPVEALSLAADQEGHPAGPGH